MTRRRKDLIGESQLFIFRGSCIPVVTEVGRGEVFEFALGIGIRG